MSDNNESAVMTEEMLVGLLALAAASLRSKGYTADQMSKLAAATGSALQEVNASLIILENNQIICIKKNGSAIAAESGVVDISVPTQTSDLLNNSGYITESSVNDKLSAAGYYKKQIVAALPNASEASENVIYCVPLAGGVTGNQYREYHLVNGNFERFGIDEPDLSGYATSANVDKATAAQIRSIVANSTSPAEKYVGTENLAEFWRQIKDVIESSDAGLSARVDLLEMILTNKTVTGNAFTISFDDLDGITANGLLENNVLNF